MLEINNQTDQKINFKKLSVLTASFLQLYKKKNYSVSLALIKSAPMRRLNNDYRGIDRTTDVLSFAGDTIFDGNDSNKYLGEVIINIDEIKKVNQYLDIFTSAPRADYLFYFIFVHGLLHLVGYDDLTEKGRLEMIKRGKDFLRKNGII
ncbi:MAG: rRNA maturation RNase YbeY [Patescibacteria group bacterium]